MMLTGIEQAIVGYGSQIRQLIASAIVELWQAAQVVLPQFITTIGASLSTWPLERMIWIGIVLLLSTVLVYWHHKSQGQSAQHAFYESLINQVADGIVVLEAGMIAYANAQFVALTGYPTDELIGKPIEGLVPPKQHELLRFRQDVETARLSTPVDQEITIVKKDGLQFDAVIIAQGTIVAGRRCTMVTVRDISASKHAEPALDSTVESLREVLNAIPFPVYVKDRELHYQIVNTAFVEFNQISPEQVLGHRMSDFVPRATAAHVEAIQQKVFTGSGSYVGDSERFAHDGQVIYAWESMQKIVMADDRELLVGSVLDITERKRLEQELRKVNEFLTTVLDTIPVPIFVQNHQRVYTVVNQAFADIHGLSPEQMIGRSDHDLFVRELADMFVGWAEQIFETKQPMTEEVELLLPDGRRRYCFGEFRLGSMPNDDKVIVGGIIDITQQKETEIELSNAREYLESIIKAIPIPFYIIDRDYRFLQMNDACCQIYGLPAGEIVGKTVPELLPSEIAAAYCHIVDIAFAQNQLFEREESYIDPLGRLYELMIRTVPYELQSGQHILIGTAIDITDRKKMERELRDAAEFLNSVINSVPDPLFVEDEAYRFIRVNDAFCRYVEQSAAELIGKTGYDLLPASEVEAFRSEDDRLLREGGRYEREGSFINNQGNRRYILMKRTANRLPSGQRILTSQFIDITNRKDVEERLREAKEAAEAASRAKSAFLSNMTHELRTPMNGVLGITTMLLDTPLNHEQEALVNTIRTSGDALLTVINQILDFSKIEAEKLELEEAIFDLRRMIEESFDLVAPQANEKSLILAYFLEDDLPLTWIQDVGRLRQIVTNLIGNAVKFTDTGEITVTVSAQPMTAETYRLHFAVADTGSGIPSDKVDLLFQSFHQLDTSIARRFGGTGLGLVISKRITEAMGGTMWVESELGQGTTFFFTIMARRDQSAHADAQNLRQTANAHLLDEQSIEESTELGKLRHKQVLVIARHPTMRRLIEQHLQAWSVQTTAGPCMRTVLESTELAVDIAQFDAMIVDEACPQLLSFDGKGIATGGELPEFLDQHPDFPIVLLTRLGQRLVFENEPQKLALVTKPVHASQLHDALLTVIYGQTAQALHQRSTDRRTNEMAHASGRPLHILLAEDNLVNQQVALGFLSKFGYRADVAANGLEALQAVERQSYDLILMDVNMPEMDGLTATGRIRALQLAAQPYIVAMTANAMYEDRKLCIDAGMDDYISKPIRIDELSAALQRVHHWLATKSANEPTVGEVDGASDESAKEGLEGMNHEPISTTLPVDPSTLQAIADIMGAEGEEMVTDLIRLYLESAPRLVADFEQGMATQNIAMAQKAAHALRSSSGQVGAHRFAELASEIDDLCNHKDLALITPFASMFQTEAEQVFSYFRREFEQRIVAANGLGDRTTAG